MRGRLMYPELTSGPHADLSAPQSSGSSSFRFGPNTPFLFHATAPLPPARKWEPYDPQRWAGTDFGLGRGSATGVEDVDMNGDAEASFSANAGEDTQAGSVPSSPKPPKAKPKPKKKRQQVTVEDEDEDGGSQGEGEERHIATGAITRVRRRRKEWARREREAAPTYNLHLGPNGTQHRDIPGILLG